MNELCYRHGDIESIACMLCLAMFVTFALWGYREWMWKKKRRGPWG